MKLQKALDEEAILEEQMLALMHRFADRFMDRKAKMEKGSSCLGEGAAEFHEDEFSKMILSWSLDEILNQNIYKDKVENIPLTFESKERYFASFVYPLPEETRSELASSLEIMCKASFADILSFKESTSGENRLYDVRVSRWRNQSSERGIDDYHTLAVVGDLLLLVDERPESLSDLKRVGRKWALSLVRRPPGTGKTTTVSVLLFILSQMKQRTLTCAPTNVAIVQLASHVLSLVRESFKTTAASGDYFYSVGDLLLFGSKEIVKVSTDIEEIYLEHRVERLAECLGPLTESELLKKKQLSNENDDMGTMLEIKSFIGFVQERFNSSAPPLRSSLESLLFQKNLVSEELEDLFNCKPLKDDIVKSLKHAILVGDERQLPAVVNSTLCNKSGFGRSLFDRLSSLGHSMHLLSVQYRMHPSISFFPNLKFYQNQILDAQNVLSKSYEKRVEKKILLLCRLHYLWILGNERTLTNSESIWKELVCDAMSRNCLFDADADECLKMTIIATNKELEELDDLINGNSVLFKHAKWKVLFSDDFRRSFGKLARSRLKKQVLNLLLKLSSGWPKNRSIDSCCKNSSQILKQFKVERLYVVCTIDIIKEARYVQVLKVWDVLALDKIPNLTNRLEIIFFAYTDAYIRRCAEKSLEGTLEVPSKGSVNSGDARNYVENSKVSESLLLMKFYSLSCGVVSHLLSGKEVDLPMQVTDEQMDIILSPKSSFIIGRSGTGKTTILTMKLFQCEQNFRIASEGIYEGENSQLGDAKVLHQLFVTFSPKLCYAVKQNVSHLNSVSSIVNSSEEINLNDTDVITSEVNDIPDTFINIPVKSYQLVITFHRFLMMLDGTLGNSFFERFNEAREGSHEKREIVYTIYETYEKMKTERREFDLGDLVNDIHYRLKNGSYEGDKMDLIYIGEVQDLSMRQISLFKYHCQNVDEGIIFAGDTAQTIARVIDFKFQDIRSLFYKEFLSTRTSGKQEKGHSIDKLEPEISLISGEAPVLLESGSDENPIVTIFGDTRTSGEVVGFGANQVILVRDDGAKTEICEYVGKNALVLTILECKGLEFQDVLLYKFFGTSPLKDQHNVLCSELKQLYVAITRTRQRLWICENKEELSKPMFDYWKMKGLVHVRELDDSVAQAMRVASSPQEWQERGKKFFYEHNFVMATLCFERAGDTMWEKLAKASGLRASADQMQGTNHEAFVSYVREAARIFESIGNLESAASCYCDLGEYERAGKLYLQTCGKIDAAAECFTLSGCYSEAAEAYAKGEQFSNSLCKKGNLFDKGLEYIKDRKEHVGVQCKEEQQIKELLESTALYYNEQKDPRTMLKFVRAFCSMESKRVLLRGDILKGGDLLEKAGHYKDATDLLIWYVFFTLLWGNGNKGWPLKRFVDKEELCNRVKSLAKMESDNYYNFVCNELNALSDQRSSLTELKNDLDVSQEYSLGGKENVADILESFQISHNEEPNKHASHISFTCIYFGVWKQPIEGNIVFSLLDKDANWIKKYGQKESKGSAFHQSTPLRIYEVRKFLLNCQHLNLAPASKKKVLNFVKISTTYFDLVFPLDWRNSVSEDLVSLRKTDLSVDLLNEIILLYLLIKDLTNSKIGRVMMILLGCRQPSGLFEMVMWRFQNATSWKSFLEKFWNNGKKDTYVTRELKNALEDTYRPRVIVLAAYLLTVLCISWTVIFSLHLSLVGWLTSFDSTGTLSTSLSISKKKIPDRKTMRSIVKMVVSILIKKDLTVSWIARSKIDPSYYHPILALKGVILLSLCCLQSSDFSEFLLALLSGGKNIAQLPPNKFVSHLLSRRKGSLLNLNPEVVAEAFLSIEDPLLIASSRDSSGNLKMPGNEDHRRQGRRFAAGSNGHDRRAPRDVEIERLRQRVRELEINSFDRYERQYEDTPTDTAVEEYENEVDRIFDLRDTPDHIKVKLGVIRLKKYASLWWDHVQNRRYREGKHRVESWDKMKRLMEKTFLPVTHKKDSYVEFHTLKQQTLTVEEFIAEFERVRMRCDEWKTAFKTRDGLYEWMVMPFGLSNAPRTGIRMDTTKSSAITTWPPLTSLHDVRSFHAAQSAFEQLKHAVTEAPVLALPNFEHVFQVECDASGLKIGGVLSQLNRPIAFFSEKLNDTRQRYSTYDKEFYAIVRILEYWRHYLLPAEFILYSDHQVLKFIQGQAKLKRRHAKWVETLQEFSFVIRHKAGSANSVADALSPALLSSTSFKVLGFAPFAHLYQDDHDFKELRDKCHGGIFRDFVRRDGFLFKGRRLCVPVSSSREAIILECHQGVLAAKTHHTNQGLYTPLPTPEGPWEDVSIDFVLGLPLTQSKKDSTMEHVDLHLKLHHIDLTFLNGKEDSGLHPRVNGPFRILKKINDNAYKVELPGHYGVSDTFNVANLSLYTPNADFDDDSGSSRFLEGEDDTDQGGSPLSPTQAGPLESG
nr:UvrD-like helicase, ATP-binding domain, P-loop containing nucleoside triphosphate hydrolase [Tanacetum cinerariifolium]